MDIKKISESNTTKRILIGIAAFIVTLLIFRAGMFVGFMKAGFSYKFGDTYYRTFNGEHSGKNGAPLEVFFKDDMMIGGHGVIGKVIKIDLPNIMIEGSDNVEKVVEVNDETIIKRFRDSASIKDIQVNDTLVVIGSPDSKGQITAKLIRLLPPPPSQSKIASPITLPTSTNIMTQ